MNKRFRACTLEQPFLLPPSLQDWLPEGHLARFIADVINELDLSAIYAEYERKDGRGLSAYHPLMLTRLLLYGYCIGITSSRRIERATYDDVAFRYLAADQHPDHDTIANFRREHLNALARLFVQALALCEKAGLVKLGNVAIDGTKLMANASTSRSVSHEKLTEREKYWQGIIDGLLLQAERTDEQEDRQQGKGQNNEMLSGELAEAQSRLARIREAKAELEREAQERLEELTRTAQERKRGRPRSGEGLSLSAEQRRARDRAKKQLQRARKQALQPTRQYNFVDPDSRVMLDNARKCFVQAYNAQIATDCETQVIVACELVQDVTDRSQLIPMVKAVCATAQRRPNAVLADAGYWDTAAFQDPALEGIDALVSPDSQTQPPGEPLPVNAPHTPEAERMRERLAGEPGKAQYALRKRVEPVFGQIKEARGIRRLRVRGLERGSAEWKLICATHNLLKLFRHRQSNGAYQPHKRHVRTRFLARPSRFSTSYRFANRHRCRNAGTTRWRAAA